MVWLAPFGAGADGGPDWLFRLWGLPFLIIGIYIMLGRFFHDAYIRKSLFYAVTDQRILTLHKSGIVSLDINRLPRLECTEHRDGTGTLAFEANNLMSWGGMNGFGLWLPALNAGSRFFRIQHPRQVYDIIRNRTAS